MCPAADGDALGGTPAANAASGGHIKKSAGWVHVFDAASVALLALIAQRKRANDDADVAEGCTQSALVVEAESAYSRAANQKEPGQCGFHDSVLPEASSNQHHAEGKENETEGQEVHGGLSGLGKASDALKAPGLSLKLSVGDALNLKLPLGGRVLVPLAHTALQNAESLSGGGLSAEMGDHVRGLHET